MTIKKMARFTVRPDGLAEALEAIQTFVDHTATEEGTLRYESWRSVDRRAEFLHLMEFADARAERSHADSDAVQTFTQVLYPLCVEGPTFEDWE